MKNPFISSWLAALLLALACGVCAQTASQGQGAPTGLGGTSWQLVKFQGSNNTRLTPDDPAKYTIAFADDGRVSARIDCNSGTGTWKSAGPHELEFGPLALTRAMCPQAALQDRITKDWQDVRSYAILDGHLFLTLMANAGTYEFEPMSEAKSAPPAPSAAPEATPPVASEGPVEYECTQAGGGIVMLSAIFYRTTPAMVMVGRGGQTRPAFQVPAASGAKYEGKGLAFWDEHGEAVVTWSGTELRCKPQ